MTDAPAVGRFAPSTTGLAHPGTLLAALLCWLDIRSRGGRLLLRLEDLDPERCRPEFAEDIRRALAWIELDWDAVELQSAARTRHEAALDALAAAGRLYACRCTRADVRRDGGVTADGTPRYPGTCRERLVMPEGWRRSGDVLRAAVDAVPDVRDEDGAPLPRHRAGDPVVRRRDGAVAYHLASVVDDAAVGVNRIVRGRDLAASTAIQCALSRLLGGTPPTYRHHLLLLEAHGEKLAKLHGAVTWHALRDAKSGRDVRRELLRIAGLPSNCSPENFRWSDVAREDRIVRWEAPQLLWKSRD